MRPDDVESAERLSAQAFAAVTGAATVRPRPARERWIRRLHHLLAHDPGGAWVADDGDVIGVAASARRDLLWVLSTYAVHPDHQGRGIGRALLDATISHGRGCLRGIICALPDPAAFLRYRRAGFSLHPTMRLAGVVDRATLPVVEGVRDGTPADLDFVDSVDRQVRGATHQPDHGVLGQDGMLLVCDLLTGRGYAYSDGSTVRLLAATNRAVAQRLLWAALARTDRGAEVTVRYLTSDQEWAVDVGLSARLRVYQDGYLAVRHMRPPFPYVPSVPFG